MVQDEALPSGQGLHVTLAYLAGVAGTDRCPDHAPPSLTPSPKGLGPARGIMAGFALGVPLWAVIGLVGWAIAH